MLVNYPVAFPKHDGGSEGEIHLSLKIYQRKRGRGRREGREGQRKEKEGRRGVKEGEKEGGRVKCFKCQLFPPSRNLHRITLNLLKSREVLV